MVFVALAATGVGLFSGSPSGAYPVAGIVLALASGASMAGYLLMSRRAGTRSAGAEPLAWAVTWAALVTVPVGVIVNGAALLEVRTVAIGAVVAVLSAVVPYSLELAALRRLPPRTVGVLQSLEPAAAGIAATVALGENLHVAQWLAVGCVSASSIGTVRRSPPPAPERSLDSLPQRRSPRVDIPRIRTVTQDAPQCGVHGSRLHAEIRNTHAASSKSLSTARRR